MPESGQVNPVFESDVLPELVICANERNDVSVQTEGDVRHITKWKLVTSNFDRDAVSDSFGWKGDASVVETQILGLDSAVQTRNAVLFRFPDDVVSEIVTTWRVVTVLLPCAWNLMIYALDLATDLAVTVGFALECHFVWFGVGLFFIVAASLFVNFYSYNQLITPDIPSVAPLKKSTAAWLFVTQTASFCLIGRKFLWCLQAWCAAFGQHRNLDSWASLWQQAKEETDSSWAKWLQGLIESVPMFCFQCYIIILKTDKETRAEGENVSGLLWCSAVVSLASASSGVASFLSRNSWEKTVVALAVFLTFGTRSIVCSAVATIEPAFWLIPPASSFVLGVLVKMVEERDAQALDYLIRMPKFMSDALVMTSICPPFNMVGFFCSVPYVFSAFCYLAKNPTEAINIFVFVLSVIGQVAWLSIGFCMTCFDPT